MSNSRVEDRATVLFIIAKWRVIRKLHSNTCEELTCMANVSPAS